MPNAIEVADLTKHYRAKTGEVVRALDGVSFEVPQGHIYGLLGPNGAGKSTVVKILSTITPLSSGRASVMGFDVTRQSIAVRGQLAVVLQQTATENLLTVRDNLLIYAYLHGVKSRVADQRLREVVEEFELGDRLRDTVQELSLGTKRRIQVAKIFMLESPVIMLDEATTGMDPLMKRRVMDRLRAEAKNGRTILLTTQVLSEAEELCENIMILDRGHAMASGTLRELRALSTHIFRVNLVFAGADGDILGKLQALNPAELHVDGNSAEMVFHGEESSLLGRLAELSRDLPILQFEVRGPTLEEVFITLMKGKSMTGIGGVFYRDYRQRMTNIGFVFWDLFVPLAYLVLFGLGFERMLGGSIAFSGEKFGYVEFLLPGVLGMVTFSVAMNTSWGFFMDKDSGIFYELLTYPITRLQLLIGKISFNLLLALIGSMLAVVLGVVAMGASIRLDLLPLTIAIVVVATAGWFFLFSVFAIKLARMDAFNTVLSAAYILLMFLSSMFYPLSDLPVWFRLLAYINPMTWQVDLLRFSLLGVGTTTPLILEGAASVIFTLVSLVLAVRSLNRAD